MEDFWEEWGSHEDPGDQKVSSGDKGYTRILWTSLLEQQQPGGMRDRYAGQPKITGAFLRQVHTRDHCGSVRQDDVRGIFEKMAVAKYHRLCHPDLHFTVSSLLKTL